MGRAGCHQHGPKITHPLAKGCSMLATLKAAKVVHTLARPPPNVKFHLSNKAIIKITPPLLQEQE